MAFIIKALGANTVTASGTVQLYTVPTTKSAVVNSVRLVNGATVTSPPLNLSVKPSGTGTTPRRIHKKDFTIAVNEKLVVEDVVTLGQGDAIQLEVGSGTQNVAYMVNGIERE